MSALLLKLQARALLIAVCSINCIESSVMAKETGDIRQRFLGDLKNILFAFAGGDATSSVPFLEIKRVHQWWKEDFKNINDALILFNKLPDCLICNKTLIWTKPGLFRLHCNLDSFDLLNFKFGKYSFAFTTILYTFKYLQERSRTQKKSLYKNVLYGIDYSREYSRAWDDRCDPIVKRMKVRARLSRLAIFDIAGVLHDLGSLIEEETRSLEKDSKTLEEMRRVLKRLKRNIKISHNEKERFVAMISDEDLFPSIDERGSVLNNAEGSKLKARLIYTHIKI